MKKIVNGKLYDTNEATSICSWCVPNMISGIDIKVQFTLYREKIAEKPSEGLELLSWGGVSDWNVKKDCSKGEFFLAVQVDGTCKGYVRPLSFDEAKHFFEEHTDSDYCVEDDYEKYFGVRPQKPLLEQLKEAFKAGAEAKQKQYEAAEAKKKNSEKEEPF